MIAPARRPVNYPLPSEQRSELAKNGNALYNGAIHVSKGRQTMTILAVFSNKGGVGKTAAAVNLAYLAGQAGVRTLLCDLDSQCSATFYFNVPPELKGSARSFAKGGKAVLRSVQATAYDNLDILPADISHRNLALAFEDLKHSKRRLAEVLDPLQERYALLILDCPPTIGLLADNVLNAADRLLTPLVPTTLSFEAHRQLLAFAREEGHKERLILSFLSMVDRRKKLHRELASTATDHFSGMLAAAIPYNADVERMGVQREPVAVFAPRSEAAAAYRGLWAELAAQLWPITAG